LIVRQIGAGRVHATYSSASEAGRQRAAPVNQFSTSDEPHHQIQRCTYEPVARRINGQIREAAKDFPS
jgi:hypothetical protein